MDKKDLMREFNRHAAEDKKLWDKELSKDPLMEYSTTQLKEQLKLRKQDKDNDGAKSNRAICW